MFKILVVEDDKELNRSVCTAMIAQFGGGDDYRRMMTAATGGGVCVIVLSMAVFMIVWSTKHIKQLKIQND